MLIFGFASDYSHPLQATELSQAFLTGIRQYAEGDFPAAITAFRQITDAGVKNGSLFYNLGNAYLRDGDLGQAILWYERALILSPGDPDLKFNYAHALSKVIDENENPPNPVLEVLLFWKHLLGEASVRWIAILLSLAAWVVLTIRDFHGKGSFRSVLPIAVILSAIFSLTALYNYYGSSRTRFAVVLPDAVPVRSGLTAGATELFTLHAGTKVEIEKEQKDHYRIFFSDGKIGWVRKPDVGVI